MKIIQSMVFIEYHVKGINRYTARDTQRDELPMENIACRERESHGIANPWAIPNRVFETQLNFHFRFKLLIFGGKEKKIG
jgi:hypothetical protein